MNPEIKKYIISVLENQRGDSLYRAECAFKNCTPEQMNQEYGESGRTRNEILEGYKKHERRVDEAIKAIKEIECQSK